MTDLPARFDAHLGRFTLEPGRALIGVSGGADSLALLDLLAGAPAAAGLDLAVLHVDHGIDPASARVAERVRAAAARYGAECHLESLSLGPGASETAARRARYARFREARDRLGATYIFVAHQADDQAETVLMRLLRGSGPAGLAGMPARRGPIVRLLLPFRHAELVGHVTMRGLEAWEDPANRDPRHDRAWIRTAILPLVEARFADAVTNLGRTAGAAAQARRGWRQVLTVLPDLGFRLEKGVASVAATPLKGYSSPLRRSILEALGRCLGISLGRPSLDRVDLLVVKGHTGQRVPLSGGGGAEVTFGRLCMARRSTLAVPEPAHLTGPEGRVEFGGWQVSWARATAPERLGRHGDTTWVAADASLTVRPWRAGDRIRPLGGRGSRLVVQCMQEAKVARSRRPVWPVFEQDGQIVWVPGVCRSDALRPEPNGEALRIDARPV